jgi:hypothetical protein
METKISKTKEFEGKIKSLASEFAKELKDGLLTGYSFFGYNINSDSNGFSMKTDSGLKMVVDGEEIRFGAYIKFERGGKSRDYAKLYIDYEMSCGRDYTIKYHDECSNNSTNKGSINKIDITDKLFNILYQMTNPIYSPSPMPMFG